jgi:sialidase-1
MSLVTRLLVFVAVAAAGIGASAAEPAAQPSAPAQPLLYTVPFKAGDAGYVIFRIPAVWTAPNRPLLAFCEARRSGRRAAGNIDLVLRRSFDLGQTWQPMQIVADLADDFCGNPCIVEDSTTGRLWLAFTRSPGSGTEETIVARTAPPTEVYITTSDNDGATWATPRNISADARKPTWGWYGTGPGLGLYVGNAEKGRLLFPAYHTDDGVYRAHCVYSDDHGQSWKLSEPAADHTSEPQIVAMPDGSLLMNARTIAGQGERRTLVESRDNGSTWRPAAAQAAPIDNHCQGCLYRCFRSGSKGEYDLIFTQPGNRQRAEAEVIAGEDGGRTWPFKQRLWRGRSAYTAMIRSQDGMVCLLMECGEKDPYQQIAFMKFAPEWVKAERAEAPK